MQAQVPAYVAPPDVEQRAHVVALQVDRERGELLRRSLWMVQIVVVVQRDRAEARQRRVVWCSRSYEVLVDRSDPSLRQSQVERVLRAESLDVRRRRYAGLGGGVGEGEPRRPFSEEDAVSGGEQVLVVMLGRPRHEISKSLFTNLLNHEETGLTCVVSRFRFSNARRGLYARTVADAPIGIFDSGFGGLTVARAVLDQLPHEPILYLGDTARQPYGTKRISEVRSYALECLDHLVEQGVKALVIACNSASAAMLRDARERYPVPVVEVIFPATRRAVAATRNGHIGVISTAATKSSLAYEDAFAAAPHVTLTTQACPKFVPFVEQGVTTGPELTAAAHTYLDPLVDAGIDTLVLGCTHYPLLTGVLSYVLGDGVTLVSSAEETAKDVYALLAGRGLERDPSLPAPRHRFLTTGEPGEFREVGRRFLGPELEQVNQFAWAAV